MTGFFLWLMGFRWLRRRGLALGLVNLSILAVAAALGTVVIEAGWYGAMTGVPWGRVLAANLDFTFSIRPSWWVLLAGLGMAALGLVRTGPAGRTARRREPRLAPAAARTPYSAP